MIVWGLDLGTKTGFAESVANTKFTAETWTLATEKEIREQGVNRGDRDRDIRIVRLAEKLRKQYIPSLIVFEDVEFIKYRLQGQLWASLRAAVWLAPAMSWLSVPVGTLKKFATGWHNATKEQMAAALKARYPSRCLPGMDDNAVDAAWLVCYGLQRQRNL